MSTLCSAGSSRRVGAPATLAWVVLVGLAIAVPIAALAGWPEDLDGGTVVLLVISGAGNVIGLGLVYTGVRLGRVGVITSVASTQGAIAALLAIVAGERPEPVTLAGFALVAGGVAMVVYQAAESAEVADPRAARLSILLGAAAAVVFGIGLYAAGAASQDVPSAWIALPARVVGVGVLLVALAAGMRPLGRPAAARLAAVAGVFEVIGFVAFAVGAKEGIAVTSVVASQFAALTVIGAFVVFRERLSPRQVAGVGVLAVGVALVALGGT
jgi:small multidrug resistance pump